MRVLNLVWNVRKRPGRVERAAPQASAACFRAPAAPPAVFQGECVSSPFHGGVPTSCNVWWGHRRGAKMSGMTKDEVHSRTDLTAVDLHDAGAHTVCQCRLQCRRRDFVLNLVTACGHPWSKVWGGLDMHTKFQRRPHRNLRLACSRATVGPSSCSPLMSGRSGSAVICICGEPIDLYSAS